MTANLLALKRAIKVAMDLRLNITSYEITPDGGFIVTTGRDGSNSPDDLLKQWVGSRRGKDHD